MLFLARFFFLSIRKPHWNETYTNFTVSKLHNKHPRTQKCTRGDYTHARVPTRMLDFGQFDFGQFDFGQLAEIELAEVEIGRSRNWPKSNRWCLLFLLSFFSFALFLLFFTFFVLTNLSLHFVSVLFRFSSPKP